MVTPTAVLLAHVIVLVQILYYHTYYSFAQYLFVLQGVLFKSRLLLFRMRATRNGTEMVEIERS